MSAFSLHGKTALVSGAAQGIGLGIAQVLATAGAHVFTCDIADAQGEKAVADIRTQGLRADYKHADVTDAREIKAFADFALGKTGRIDIAVCNASYTSGPQNGVLNASPHEWDMNIRTALMGMQHLTAAALPSMIEQRGGSVIVISSIQALAGCAASAAYTTVKAGQLGFVRSAACDYGQYNVRVNALCPGPINVAYSPEPGTPIHDLQIQHTMLRRTGSPQDIGYAVLFLVSDEASFITGAVLPVDGGWTAM
jgi:NAD(P)-dependent dehydrogenase (short-subunit alcohol dehydrogenase family)